MTKQYFMKQLFSFITIILLLLAQSSKAQSITGNTNLIPNASFEFGTIYNDTGFSNNNYCWTRANELGAMTTPFGYVGYDPTVYPFPRHGKRAGILARGYCWYKPSAGTWNDTVETSRAVHPM